MKQTQAQRLHAALRTRWHSYLDMQMLGVSTSPHRRLAEGMHYLHEGERLERKVINGLVHLRVTKA